MAFRLSSSVGIATDYGAKCRGVGALALGPTDPPIQWAPGALSQAVMRPGREADHLPPTSAEVEQTSPAAVQLSRPPYLIRSSLLTALTHARVTTAVTRPTSAGFDAITAATTQNVATPCWFIANRRFGGTCRVGS
jgi:hypothetical protein